MYMSFRPTAGAGSRSPSPKRSRTDEVGSAKNKASIELAYKLIIEKYKQQRAAFRQDRLLFFFFFCCTVFAASVCNNKLLCLVFFSGDFLQSTSAGFFVLF
jgi:hypothetical protein